jgi:CRISPR-associated protein Cas2
MLIVVSYDVATSTDGGARRLRRIAKECKNFGRRVQKSVFECQLDPTMWATFKLRLLKIYDPSEDSLRFYFLGSNWHGDIEHHGANPPSDPDAPIIV